MTTDHLVLLPNQKPRRGQKKSVPCVDKVVTPAEAGVQMQFTICDLTYLDSGFHRNDKELSTVSFLNGSEEDASEFDPDF
jgi:hypothetical protein